MQRSPSRRAALAGVAVAALATAAAAPFAPAAHAQADAAKADEGALKYRQSLMEAVGGDMAALSNLMKYGLVVPGAAATHAEGLASHAKLVAAAFEHRVTAGRTDAKPAIWEKPAEFQQAVEKFQTETARLAEVARGSDLAALGAQLKATGKACGDCHDAFRKPKEESYHRAGSGH
jgi:cytochrome c556